MPTFKFAGDGPVDIPALGLVDVEKGRVVDVDDETARGMKGSDAWEPVSKSTTKNKES